MKINTIVGQCYYRIVEGHPKWSSIFYATNTEGGIGAYIQVDEKIFRPNHGGGISEDYHNILTIVSAEQKQWIDACIKANKYIPFEEALCIINNYEIY